MGKQGRTVTTIVWLSVAALLGLLICVQAKDTGGLFVALCALLGTLGGVQGAKSTLEATATGIGLKGAAKAIAGTDTPPTPAKD